MVTAVAARGYYSEEQVNLLRELAILNTSYSSTRPRGADGPGLLRRRTDHRRSQDEVPRKIVDRYDDEGAMEMSVTLFTG
jgi:hypothetical protein